MASKYKRERDVKIRKAHNSLKQYIYVGYIRDNTVLQRLVARHLLHFLFVKTAFRTTQFVELLEKTAVSL
jgi:hypothetical protein